MNLRDVSITCFSCFQIVALPNDPGLVEDLRGTVVEAMPSRQVHRQVELPTLSLNPAHLRVCGLCQKYQHPAQMGGTFFF